MKTLLMICLLAAPALSRASDAAVLNGLSQNAIQSAFQMLRRDYIRREDLSFEELNRAALQGLLERLDFGAEITPADVPTKAPAAKVHAEFLAPGIAYMRPESFGEGQGVRFEKALAEIVE